MEITRPYMKLRAPTLDEAIGQLLSPMPDPAFLPYCSRHGFLPRCIRIVLNTTPNRELNVGEH